MKHRIVYKPDGSVSIINPIPEAKREDETEEEFLTRNQNKIPALAGLPYDDVEKDDLPADRSQRDKWRGSKGAGVYVDESVITEPERRKALEEELDLELERQNPNPVTAIRLQRRLQKKDY